MPGLEHSSGLSVVIPALNAAPGLAAALHAVTARASGLAPEVVVVDGGSTDDTRAIARQHGARVIRAARGRGTQLAAGAAAAAGHWLLFLHADTRLAPGWGEAVAAFTREPANADRAGYFRFALDDAAAAARRVEATVAWRNRVLGLPYGDQGLLISRAFYRAVGGYRPLPLMEDVDLVRRVGRRRLVLLDVPAITSAVRYRRDGYIGRPLRNAACLSLYLLGVPPHLIVRLYR
ncbi:MAG: glycosyltransferase [Rhodospirillales bacterium]|nr:MAG: glycosyltransferase [Rhodospirillales bacterium]